MISRFPPYLTGFHCIYCRTKNGRSYVAHGYLPCMIAPSHFYLDTKQKEVIPRISGAHSSSEVFGLC